MKSIKEFFVLFLFFSLLTYFVMFFKRQESAQMMDNYGALSEFSHNAGYFVSCREDEVSLSLPVEYYLVGALAASVPVEYEPELLKAQAIVLRSTLCSNFAEGKYPVSEEEDAGFWSDKEMQSVWGDAYEENVKKCLDAVIRTQGVYLAYNGKPIEGFFHGMSAGQTRDGAELSHTDEYGYLKKADCTDNLAAPEYAEEIKIRVRDVGELKNPVTNESGYVITLQREGENISGEKFQKESSLPSSNVTWERDGEYYIFRSRGKGHGFGLDQYYGNVLAKKGMDYREILAYFFSDITYQRME